MALAEFRSALIVEVDDTPGRFKLVQELRYYSALLAREIVVPAAYVTDFASIPWVFHSFCQVNGKHRKAAVVHDYLCTHGREMGISQKKADHVFLEAMEVLGVRWSQRRVMYRAVRTYQTVAGWFRGSNIVTATTVELFVGVVLALTLGGCTFARYSDGERSLTVIDIHPTGNTVYLDAALVGKGRVQLNREQGTAEGLVNNAVNAAAGGLLGPLRQP